MAEFAPGIPKKKRIVPIPLVEKPKIWKFGLQFHDAERAGKHFDLRIGDPRGNAHSWAIQRLPEPGEKVLAIQQPTHTVSYMPFQGKIESGYGKGDVKSVRFEPTEVVKAGPDRVTFHLHKGHQTEEYSLIRWVTKGAPGLKSWILHNHTITRDAKPQLPSSKPGYREIPFEQVVSRLARPNEAMAAKIDGGHNTFLFERNKPLRIFSYRPTERATGLIEHTHKVPQALRTRTPKELNGTILRGELYARDKSGTKPLPAETVGGMLNANTWLSRERQKAHGPLRAAIFDVVQWRGKNVEKAPYAEKLEMLHRVKQLVPWMEIPETATDPKSKLKLLRKITQGKHPQTREGVVFWDMTQGTPPVKAKILQEHDVVVKGFQEGAGGLKGRGIGAIRYGTTQNPKEVKGKVGTGFSRSMREHMYKNPSLYIGKTMKVKSQGKFPSGALRAPRFVSMHLDTLEGGEKVAFVAMVDELAKIARKVPLGRRIKKKLTVSPRTVRYAARYFDDIVRAVRRRLSAGADREKRADTSAQGPGGFLEKPYSSRPTSALDSQGRLRTNDEPTDLGPHRKIPVAKRRRKRNQLKLYIPLRSNEHQDTRGYHGAEPEGVTRSFHANHENYTA